MPPYDLEQIAERLQRSNEVKDVLIEVQAKAIEHTTKEACAYFLIIAETRTRASERGDMRMVTLIDAMLEETNKALGRDNGLFPKS